MSDDDDNDQDPMAVYLSKMSGTLTTDTDGFPLFLRDAGDMDPQFIGDSTLADEIETREELEDPQFRGDSTLADEIETQEELDDAKRFLFCNASGTPRLLFRGFNSKSGGGHDAKLNSKDGIIPHGFLNGEEPTEMWDIPTVSDEIIDHLANIPVRHTHFSSWTQMLVTALDFARSFALCPPDWDSSSTIAVLDTKSMVEHVWLSADLYASGLCIEGFTDEYLIYGPVSGPNYHCVSVKELLRTTRVLEIINWDEAGDTASFGDDRISLIERGAVEASRDLAKALQPRKTGLDKILMLTARFVGDRAAQLLKGMTDSLSYPDISGFLFYARDDLQGLATRDDARRISLAVPDMSTEHSQALMFEVQMLLAAENAVHIMGWMWRAGPSRYQEDLAKAMLILRDLNERAEE
ncbi:hypothetical protein INS49_015463 [Diaporthe citri]|uniref:uncharacterized protein n=1 Tax=Diaporthe citri TaxID=83186 RepID=UPI001C810594|nr:uncharacterized protein INS49_015463 [Diaporthe citri]KAG6356078.1 hypothetical protein INS49_015463 [Diaporthe citri]